MSYVSKIVPKEMQFASKSEISIHTSAQLSMVALLLL